MKKGIIGKKLGMTQIFDEAGNVIPVTVLEAGPCVCLLYTSESSPCETAKSSAAEKIASVVVRFSEQMQGITHPFSAAFWYISLTFL